MRVPDAVAEVYVTDQLSERIAGRPDYPREKLAAYDIAKQMVNDPTRVLPRLVDLAIELCNGVAGGISMYEPAGKVFRWHYLRGTLEQFNGATTPRDYSPCGITLDQKSAVLVQRPERVYSWLVDANVSLAECLLVPLYVGEAEPLGTLWIVSEDVGHFDNGHAALMQELAGFTGMALHMTRSEDRLKAALEEQETLTREMGHRVKNLFAITDGMIRMSARASTTKEALAEALSGRLHALSEANALVRRTFSAPGHTVNTSNLSEVLAAVLKPYTEATTKFEGPLIELGERTTNTIALIFHELATNSAKYGAFGAESGMVSVAWKPEGDMLEMVWTETGGPPIETAPETTGFGTRLVTNSVTRQGGKIGYAWRPEGVHVTMSMPLADLID